jgi:CheY-like chemotaxis protein
MGKLLGRLIGENIVLATGLAPHLPPVRVDRGQIEQVILNLAVNARDAMPDGGKLTIETMTLAVDEPMALPGPNEVSLEGPGRYVVVAVSDTGVGMDHETQRRVFEPFFTTKEAGKGTGLGLSTVYGIVKQSGGEIWLYSEPGVGTTFKVYLPEQQGEEKTRVRGDLAGAPVGSETILLTEDEPGVRALARSVLETKGYHVLTAATGEEALALTRQHPGAIHLLVTDLVLPDMNGRTLSEEIARLRPEAALLYMSGYTDDVVIRHGIIDAKIAFLQKPFTAATLASKVREVLGHPRANAEDWLADKHLSDEC